MKIKALLNLRAVLVSLGINMCWVNLKDLENYCSKFEEVNK